MILMGIDFGDARVGVALSDETELIATARETITVTGVNDAARKVAQAYRTAGAVKIVCGLPYNMNGSESFRAEKTRIFAGKLQELTGAEVVFVDERLTTVEAYGYMNIGDMKSGKRRSVIDALSAQIILQSYLDAESNRKKREVSAGDLPGLSSLPESPSSSENECFEAGNAGTEK